MKAQWDREIETLKKERQKCQEYMKKLKSKEKSWEDRLENIENRIEELENWLNEKIADEGRSVESGMSSEKERSIYTNADSNASEEEV